MKLWKRLFSENRTKFQLFPVHNFKSKAGDNPFTETLTISEI